MKQVLLLFIILFSCNNLFATECSPYGGYIITDAASCPCGYIDAGTAPSWGSCGSYGTSAGTYTWGCS